MSTDGLYIRIEIAPDYDVPSGVREALERLAEELNSEANRSEVEGFGAEVPIPPNPFDVTPGKFGPKEPLQGACLGGFQASSSQGGGYCNWVFFFDS